MAYLATAYRAEGISATIVGSLSFVASGSIVASRFLFPYLFEKKMFMHIIWNMALSDAIASLGFSFGFPFGALCEAQAILTTFFYLSSWIWVTLLSYQLFRLVMRGRAARVPLWALHVFTWSLTLVICLVPLSSTSYGSDDGMQGTSLCAFRQGKSALLFLVWSGLTIYAPLLLCMALQFYFSVQVQIKFSFIDAKHVLIKRAVMALFYYPVGMLVCWTPFVMMQLLLAIIPPSQQPPTFLHASNATVDVGASYGIYLSILYYYNNSQARSCWLRFFCLQQQNKSNGSDKARGKRRAFDKQGSAAGFGQQRSTSPGGFPKSSPPDLTSDSDSSNLEHGLSESERESERESGIEDIVEGGEEEEEEFEGDWEIETDAFGNIVLPKKPFDEEEYRRSTSPSFGSALGANRSSNVELASSPSNNNNNNNNDITSADVINALNNSA